MRAGVLMVTAMAQAENCAGSLARELGLTVEVAATRKAGLEALRRREYSVLVVDDAIVEADSAGADLLWKYSGLAFPMQFNFAISGGSRLAREVRAALARRAQEQALALRTAACILDGELKSTAAGLLLQSQRALTEPTLSPKLEKKLKLISQLAARLRQQLEEGGIEANIKVDRSNTSSKTTEGRSNDDAEGRRRPLSNPKPPGVS